MTFLTGVGKFLRVVSENRVKICLTDPRGAAMVRYYNEGELRSEGSSITEGIGQGMLFMFLEAIDLHGKHSNNIT